MNTTIRVGFVLVSREESPIPSTRIAILNMIPFLHQANIEPVIVFQPAVPTEKPDVSGLGNKIISDGFNIIVFQKVHGPSVESLIQELRTAGIKTVYCVCDLVEIRMVTAADTTIVVTDYLKRLYPPELHKKIHVVHDGIEHPEYKKLSLNQNRGSRSRPLKAVLVTSAALDSLPAYLLLPEWLSLTILGRYADKKHWFQRVREARWNIMSKQSLQKKYGCFRFYTNTQISTEPWEAKAVYDHMCAADIGIIPIDSNSADPEDAAWRVKSENRLTMNMAVGLPVIASPIPSYEPVIVQGQNGFLACSRDDWMNCFVALRDPALRERIGEEARKSVVHRFSMEEQAQHFIKVLRSLI